VQGRLLSIIITNYNTGELLRNCLRTLTSEPPASDWTLAVVDNCSSDRSLEIVKNEFPIARIVAMKTNAGFPKAVNTGIRSYPAEYYFILNSDTEVLPRQARELLGYMRSHPFVGALSPGQVSRSGRPQLAWGDFPTLFSEARRKALQDRLDLGDLKALSRLQSFSETFEVDWIAGSTMLLRNEALRRAGLMDERFFIYFEDIDLCRRIRESGWEVIVRPEVAVIHHRGEAMKKEKYASMLHYRRSQLAFWSKHHGHASCLMLRLFLALKFSSRLAAHAVASIGKKDERPESDDAVRHAKDVLKLILKGGK
jgi:hypothetical protein